MKKVTLLLVGITTVFLVKGQTVNIQAGTSFSKLDWSLTSVETPKVFEESMIGYSFFAGIDYLDKSYFNLSSNIGMIRKGGKGVTTLYDGIKISEKPTMDYLSLNTTIDFKYRIREKIAPFIGFGPRFDYLLNSSRHFDELIRLDKFNDISFGLIFGGGLKYDISDFRFGLRANYYLDFKNVAEWTGVDTGMGGKISVNVFTLNLSVGYRLK